MRCLTTVGAPSPGRAVGVPDRVGATLGDRGEQRLRGERALDAARRGRGCSRLFRTCARNFEMPFGSTADRSVLKVAERPPINRHRLWQRSHPRDPDLEPIAVPELPTGGRGARRLPRARRARGRARERALSRRASGLDSADPLKLYVRQLGDGRAADAGRGARARPPQGSRRRGRQAPARRVEPAPRDVDHAPLHEGRRPAPRPDPGGQPRPDPRGREVRLPPRLQALDVCDVVDPPGDQPRALRPGPHDPPARARRRAGPAGPALAPPPRAEAQPRPDARGDRPDRGHSPERVAELLELDRATRSRSRRPSATARACTATSSRTMLTDRRTPRRPRPRVHSSWRQRSSRSTRGCSRSSCALRARRQPAADARRARHRPRRHARARPPDRGEGAARAAHARARACATTCSVRIAPRRSTARGSSSRRSRRRTRIGVMSSRRMQRLRLATVSSSLSGRSSSPAAAARKERPFRPPQA